MNKAVSIFTLLALLSLAFAQLTCPCRRNSGTNCRTITLAEVVGGAQTCVQGFAACSGCVCDLSASKETCLVSKGLSYQYNGTASFCSTRSVEVAECPSTTPAPVTFQTETTCCTVDTTGSISNTPCSLRAWNNYGLSNKVVAIDRYIVSLANITTTYVSPPGSETLSFTSYAIRGQFTYAIGIPTVFINFVSPTSDSDAFLNPAGSTAIVSDNFETRTVQDTLTSGTVFNQILATTAPTIPYNTSLQFDLSGPGASVRIGIYKVSQCIGYRYQA